MMGAILSHFGLMMRMMIFCAIFIGPPAAFALLNSAYPAKATAFGLVIYVSLQRA